MEVSILLMQQIAQLFIVLLMGYVVVKAGLLKASDSKVLSVVFVYLVMPCVVLNAFQIDDTPQIRTGLLYSMGIAVGMHVVFLVLNAIFKRPLKLDVVAWSGSPRPQANPRPLDVCRTAVFLPQKHGLPAPVLYKHIIHHFLKKWNRLCITGKF